MRYILTVCIIFLGVRRLHTQNLTLDMTLGLDSESEMDTSRAETIDVDASCLERRTSTVSATSDTPSRKSRKNTSVVTEISGEDEVFNIPDGEIAVMFQTGRNIRDNFLDIIRNFHESQIEILVSSP